MLRRPAISLLANPSKTSESTCRSRSVKILEWRIEFSNVEATSIALCRYAWSKQTLPANTSLMLSDSSSCEFCFGTMPEIPRPIKAAAANSWIPAVSCKVLPWNPAAWALARNKDPVCVMWIKIQQNNVRRPLRDAREGIEYGSAMANLEMMFCLEKASGSTAAMHTKLGRRPRRKESNRHSHQARSSRRRRCRVQFQDLFGFGPADRTYLDRPDLERSCHA
jgi:hypothetical protein